MTIPFFMTIIRTNLVEILHWLVPYRVPVVPRIIRQKELVIAHMDIVDQFVSINEDLHT